MLELEGRLLVLEGMLGVIRCPLPHTGKEEAGEGGKFILFAQIIIIIVTTTISMQCF